jgi:hypothetical protein
MMILIENDCGFILEKNCDFFCIDKQNFLKYCYSFTGQRQCFGPQGYWFEPFCILKFNYFKK